jgi:surface protein
MNMKRYLTTLIALMAMAMGTKAIADEMSYAYFENGTLRFCHDNQFSSHPEENRFRISDAYPSLPSWYSRRSEISRVIFEESFKKARPNSMKSWFVECENLSFVIGVENVNTSQVTTMESVFERCYNLQSALDLNCWDTSKVTNMMRMFSACRSLPSLSVSEWNTSNVTDMYGMFSTCRSLTTLDVSKWDTSKVLDMGYLFAQCTFQSLDVSNWNTSSVTSIEGMFYHCSGLTSLDLSGWDTSGVINMDQMFYECESLTTIYCGEKWVVSATALEVSYWMFDECKNLVGEKGTIWENYTTRSSAKYAHVDGGSDNPGYFTMIKKYDLWVAGKQVRNSNQKDVLGDGGSVSLIKNVFGKYVLILENANITNTGDTNYEFTGYGRGIYSNMSGLTIRVKGNNTIDSKGEGIYFTDNLSISGNSDNQGKLSVKGSYGIRPAKSSTAITLDISRVELTAEGTSGAGIGASTSFSSSSSYNCTMTVGTANTVVKAKGTSVSLGNLNSLVFEDGLKILQPTGASFNGEDVIDANGNIIKGSWVIIKGESGISTGVALPQDKAQSQDAWYTLDGRKLNGQPTKKGVYIHNGKTIIR